MTGTFSCTLKFLVKDCDPNTGEPDDEGYDDEYVVSTHSTLHTALRLKGNVCMAVSTDLARASAPKPSHLLCVRRLDSKFGVNGELLARCDPDVELFSWRTWR